MKSIYLLLAGALLLPMFSHAAFKTGSSAPEFTLTDSQGKTHNLSDYKGKYVVLEWTRHSCPFVVKFYEDGHMQRQQKAMTDAGVVWLQIASSAEGKPGYLSTEAAEEMRKKQKAQSTAFLIDADGTVGRSYDARTTPHMFLINPEGTLIYQGAIDSIKSAKASDIAKATNYVDAAYKSAIAGEPIESDTPVPYGCGVKY